MTSLTIFYGAAHPIRARGVHCCRLLAFAEKYRGWHTAARDRITQRAVASLARIGCLEVAGDQFRFTYPRKA